MTDQEKIPKSMSQAQNSLRRYLRHDTVNRGNRTRDRFSEIEARKSEMLSHVVI